MNNDLIPANKRLHIKPTFGHDAAAKLPDDAALLLDISGSMAEWIEPRRSKLDALKQLVQRLPDVATYVFSAECRSVSKAAVQELEPDADTELWEGFRYTRMMGARHVLLITDGWPTFEHNPPKDLDTTDKLIAWAKQEFRRVDVLYVGPHPAPDFLIRLTSATGGSCEVNGDTLLRATDIKQLAQKVVGLLKA